MKTILALSLLIVSFTSFATSITTVSFNEDGFGTSGVTCFKGKAASVCPIIEDMARGTRDEYSGGAHGYFDVRTCEVNEKGVNLSYERITDYGNEDVKIVLSPCAE